MPGVLGKILQEAEDVEVDLQVRGEQEGAKDLAEHIKSLAEFLTKIRTTISENGNLKKDEVREELIEELENLIQQGLAHRSVTTCSSLDSRANHTAGIIHNGLCGEGLEVATALATTDAGNNRAKLMDTVLHQSIAWLVTSDDVGVACSVVEPNGLPKR